MGEKVLFVPTLFHSILFAICFVIVINFMTMHGKMGLKIIKYNYCRETQKLGHTEAAILVMLGLCEEEK